MRLPRVLSSWLKSNLIEISYLKPTHSPDSVMRGMKGASSSYQLESINDFYRRRPSVQMGKLLIHLIIYKSMWLRDDNEQKIRGRREILLISEFRILTKSELFSMIEVTISNK
jgi:hypothetical protein